MIINKRIIKGNKSTSSVAEPTRRNGHDTSSNFLYCYIPFILSRLVPFTFSQSVSVCLFMKEWRKSKKKRGRKTKEWARNLTLGYPTQPHMCFFSFRCFIFVVFVSITPLLNIHFLKRYTKSKRFLRLNSLFYPLWLRHHFICTPFCRCRYQLCLVIINIEACTFIYRYRYIFVVCLFVCFSPIPSNPLIISPCLLRAATTEIFVLCNTQS